MSGELDAMGDVVAGAMVGRAVEAAHGEPVANTQESVCLNCAAPLTGPYCQACGQRAHVHRTLTALGHEIAHGVFHFEGKIWRTLPLLFWRPGDLTRRYVNGERARFVSPMALFLFSVFLTFATISMIGGNLEAPGDTKLDAGTNAEVSVKQSREGLSRAIAKLDKQIADAKAAGKKTGNLRKERANVAGILRFMEGGPSVLSGAETRGKMLGFKTGWVRLDKGVAKANENPNLSLYKLQTNAYKLSWALIPISVPFVWLIFAWRRRFHAYDHAVFVTYSLSFMMLLAIVLTIAGAAGLPGDAIAVAALIIPPAHMFAQLRKGYGLTRFSALWRTVALVIFAAIVMVAFLLLLIALGLIG